MSFGSLRIAIYCLSALYYILNPADGYYNNSVLFVTLLAASDSVRKVV